MQTGRPSKRPRPPFGQRLYDFRNLVGLTQHQMAQELGISSRAYAFWEREPVAIRPEQMLILAEVLGVSADQLIGRDNTAKQSVIPINKLRLVFEKAGKLSRKQQIKIAEFVEAFVDQHSKTS